MGGASGGAVQGLGFFVLVFAAVYVYLILAVVRGTRRALRERRARNPLVRGRAVVLDTRTVHGGVGDGPTVHVRARLRTADGREFTGWASGDYGRASRAWPGHEIAAWYDPGDPQSFQLRPPGSAAGIVARSAAVLIVFLAFLSLFVTIYFLESR